MFFLRKLHIANLVFKSVCIMQITKMAVCMKFWFKPRFKQSA